MTDGAKDAGRKRSARTPATRKKRPTTQVKTLERENERLRARIAALEQKVAHAAGEANVRLEALRASEAKYRRLHESRMDAFVSTSMDGRIREFNLLYERMLGYPADELLELTYEDLTPAKWHAFEAGILEQQVFVRDYSDVYEKEYRRKDGTIFPVELRTILIRDDAGRPAGMWAMVRDITERKAAENALRESQSSLELAMKIAALGFYSQQGTVGNRSTYFDDRALALLRIPPDQVARTHEYWIEHLHPDDLPHIAEASRGFETGGVDRAAIEYRFLRGPDDVIWLRHVVHALERDPAGRTTRLVGIIQDVTEFKAAEAAVRESEEKFKTAFLTSVDAFFISTLDEGRLLEVNTAFVDLFGYSPAELIGRTASEIGLFVDDGDRLRMRQQLRSAGLIKDHDAVGRKKSGERVTCSLSARPLDLRGRPCLIGVIRDVSEPKRAEQALAESEQRFRTLIEDAPVAIRLNRGDRVIYANQRYLKLFGYDDLGSLVGLPIATQWAPENRDDIEYHLKRTASWALDGMQYEGTALRQDGTQFSAHASLGQIELPDGPAIIAFVTDITEQRRAQEELRRSEQRFRSLIEDAPIAIRVNRGQRTLYANPRYVALYGYDTAEELLRVPVLELWAPECRDQIHEQIGRFAAGVQTTLEYEGVALRQDGSRFPLHTSIGPVLLPEGPAIIVFATDITERKQAEQQVQESRRALAESQETLLALINSTRDLIWSVDVHRFGLLTFNQGLADYFARRGVECRVGMDPADLQLPPAYAATWHERYNRALRAGPFVEEYTPFQGYPVLMVSLNLVKRAGEVVAISVFGRDISDIKKAELALRHSEQRFREVAETVSDFIWEVDAEGVYTYTSPAVERILGYRPEELVGRKHFYDLFVDSEREELTRAALEVFAARESFRGFSNANLSKDGRLVRLETSGAPMVDEAGHLVGYRGADSDVTERWLNEIAVRDLTGRLIEAQEVERSRLARELHDDFSQRLALVAVRLDLLQQSPPDGIDDLRATIDSLRDHVQALGKDIRRMSHELHPARLEQLGLASAVRGLCSDLCATARVAIRCDVRDVPRDVPDAVALCLYRVAQEALQNVIKHSQAANAVIELAESAAGLRLRVGDDGRGFDMAAVQAGDTLGLANMRERVRSIGGRLTIESAPGQGTRIEVHAPVALPDPLTR